MDGAPGSVAVAVEVNDDPEALGCRPAARGFPYCIATVRHPAREYTAALGWIQLVRSTDGLSVGDEFEMPYEPLGPIGHPFAFFGFLPTLFDAPSRDPVIDIEWLAHALLRRLTETGAGWEVTALTASPGDFQREQARSGRAGPSPCRAKPGTRTGRRSRANIPNGPLQAQRTLRVLRLVLALVVGRALR
jgi:hypothetical protein